MEFVVHLRGAVSLLGRFPALAGVDLDVAPGEIVLVQGPNGAGKSTLLRTCAGLLPVVAGTAEVLGHDLVADRRTVRRRVGLLGHATGLYDDLTVADNVHFWARAAGAEPADAEAAIARAGLAGRLHDVQVARLSAGQRRRTALAVLLARRPELWLLDEPHAGLDVDGRELVDLLVTGAAAAGATVLLASHDLDRATALAHRSVTISGGTIVSGAPTDGPPATATTAPVEVAHVS
jgi:heme ABC exporter ATP-binding subunit CcmA